MKKKKEKIQELIQHFMQYRPKDSSTIRHIPAKSDAGEFDEFMCSWNSGSSPKLTAGLICRLTADADTGAASDLAMLFRTMLEKEPAIAAHFQTRVQAVLACDWSVQGTDQVKVNEVTKILQMCGIHSLLRHLLDALAFGYAGAAILWDEGGKGIRAFRKICTQNWVFDLTGNPALITVSGQPRSLAEYHPNQFVLHTHKMQSGPCQQGGLLRPLLWLYFFKHYAMRDRARAIEKFGIPFLIAKIRDCDFEDENVRNTILNSLAKMGSDGAGVITEGSELQFLAPSSGNAYHQEWLEYIDRLFALLILGQTASSSDARGFSNGQIQENVRRDLLEADCRALMETVTEQIIAPLERFRYGTDHTLQFNLDFSMPEKLDEKANIVKLLTESGFRPNPAWIEKTFGIELMKGTEK